MLVADYLSLGGSTRRFGLHYKPHAADILGAILLLPPFGEELNKSRRTLALSARRFAAAGYAVLQIDLYGCGDSEGDFSEATWAIWSEDLRKAEQWLRGLYGQPPWLWAVRAGSLLAADIVKADMPLLLWQPVINGEQFLSQILRAKVVSESLTAGRQSNSTRELRALLDAGVPVEVGGYMLNPELALPLAKRTLAAFPISTQPVLWLETGPAVVTEPPFTVTQTVAKLRAGGIQVGVAQVIGEPFWMTLEIGENLALIERSLEMMGEGRG